MGAAPRFLDDVDSPTSRPKNVPALSAVAAALVAAQLLRKRDEEEEAASAAEAAQPQSDRPTEYPDPHAERRRIDGSSMHRVIGGVGVHARREIDEI